MGQTINLNIIPKGIPDVVNASQYDVGRVVQFALYDGASPYNIPQGATVQIAGKKGDNTIFCYDDTDNVVSWSGNTVTITSTQQMTAYAGEVLAQLRVINNSVTPATVLATVNFKMLIQVRPDAEGDISETEIPAIIALAEAEMYNAEAWAKGTKNGTPVSSSEPQYNNNSKYWSDKAQEYAVGAVHYKGVTLFQYIPTTGMVNGDMYNVADDFTTDARFEEGPGKFCAAGTNIIWDEAISKWDIAGGLGGVTSWNGRRGDITPQANDYTAAQVKYSEGVSVQAELLNKQNEALATPLTIGDIVRTNVESALGALTSVKADTSSLGTAAAKNVPVSGNASTTEVVMGNDTRLSDARNAADVYSWAKAATKPSYNASEVGALPSNTLYAGSASAGGAATSAVKVNNALSISTANSNDITFQGNKSASLDMLNIILEVSALGWSNTVDADGFYYQDVVPMSGSLVLTFDVNKPFSVGLAGASQNVRPTDAEKAAYNMIDENYTLADSGQYFRFYTKTKPTTTFHVRAQGFHTWQST